MVLLQRRFLRQPPWVANELWRRARAVPSLDLRFAETKSLNDVVSGQNLITFTRASSGTYVGSDGLIKTAAVDTPRFDHDPTTGESLGLLVEESRTNLLLQSDNLTLSPWGYSSGITPTYLGAVGPLGLPVTRITNNSSPVGPGPQQFISVVSGTVYTASFWVRGISSFSPTLIVVFNDGSITVPVTTSWQRVSVQITASSTGSVGFRFDRLPTANAVYEIAGMQLEVGSFPTSYIPTTSATVTRSADVASITGANFTRWYKPNAFTVYSDATGPSITTTTTNSGTGYPNVYTLSQSQSNRMTGARSAGSNNGAWSLFQTPPDRFAYSTNANFNTTRRHRIGGSYQPSEYLAFANGVIGDTISVGATPSTFTTLSIGSGTDGGYWGGTISRLTYWQSRLPNSILQDITR